MKNILVFLGVLILIFGFCDGQIKLTDIKYACTANEVSPGVEVSNGKWRLCDEVYFFSDNSVKVKSGGSWKKITAARRKQLRRCCQLEVNKSVYTIPCPVPHISGGGVACGYSQKPVDVDPLPSKPRIYGSKALWYRTNLTW